MGGNIKKKKVIYIMPGDFKLGVMRERESWRSI